MAAEALRTSVLVMPWLTPVVAWAALFSHPIESETGKDHMTWH